MTDSEAKEKIFSLIINAQISTYEYTYAPDEAVIPISDIIRNIDGLTKYRARKAIKLLIADGIVCYKSQGCPAIESCGEYRELIAEARPPINGYCLTKKGYNSPEYRQAYKAWCKALEEYANGY